MTNRAKGTRPRGIERQVRWRHDTLSVWGQRGEALAKARQFPAMGAWVAVLEIEPGDPEVEVVKTLGPGHYSVHGSPAALLRRVVAVEPVW